MRHFSVALLVLGLASYTAASYAQPIASSINKTNTVVSWGNDGVKVPQLGAVSWTSDPIKVPQ